LNFDGDDESFGHEADRSRRDLFHAGVVRAVRMEPDRSVSVKLVRIVNAAAPESESGSH
jgi:hypothetical protein